MIKYDEEKHGKLPSIYNNQFHVDETKVGLAEIGDNAYDLLKEGFKLHPPIGLVIYDETGVVGISLYKYDKDGV